jgi:hypothetical protein
MQQQHMQKRVFKIGKMVIRRSLITSVKRSTGGTREAGGLGWRFEEE